MENGLIKVVNYLDAIKGWLQNINGLIARIVEIIACFFGITAFLQNPLATTLLGLLFFGVHFVSRRHANAPIVDVKIFTRESTTIILIAVGALVVFSTLVQAIFAFAGFFLGTAFFYVIIGAAEEKFGATQMNPKKTYSWGESADTGFALLIQLGVSLGLAALILNAAGLVDIQDIIKQSYMIVGYAMLVAIIIPSYNRIITKITPFRYAVLLICIWAIYNVRVKIAFTLSILLIILETVGYIGFGLMEAYLATFLFFGRGKSDETAPDASVPKIARKEMKTKNTKKN